MPANLTQQYLKAEERYRRAATLEEELLVPSGDDEGDPQAQGDRSPSGGTEVENRQDQEGDGGRKERRREEGPRPANSAAGGGHGRHPRRAERRQEPTGRQPDPRHARGRPVSVHHDRARPGHDALGRRDGAVDRHAAGHGRLHGPASAQPDPRRRPGPVDGRSGERRRHRTVPGVARSARRRRRPGWRRNRASTRRTSACRTRRRSCCRTRSTPPARPSGSSCCTSCCRWISPST